MDVRMPDGTVIKNVPEGTTKEQLVAKLQASGKYSGELPETRSFLQRSKETLTQGVSDAMSSLAGDSFTTGGDKMDLSPSERTSEALGGGVLPAVGQVGADAFVTGAKQVLPESVTDAVGEGFGAVMGSKPVQKVAEGWNTLADKYPDYAAGITQGANIGSIGMPKMKTPKVRWVGNADAAVAKMKNQTRMESVARMLEPDNMDGPGKIVTKGPLKTKTYEATPWEQEMYREVNKVKGVKPSGNYTDNFNAVEAEVGRLAKELDAKLMEVPEINANRILGPINDAVEQIAKQPTLVGDAGKSAELIFDMYINEVKKFVKPGAKVSLRDMLQARRNLDDLLYSTDKNIFDVNTSKAKNYALSEIRKTVHDLIEEVAPDSGLKDSLKKQSHLLTARDTMHPRMIGERGNAITRAVSALERDTGVAHPTTPLGIYANASNPITAAAMAALAGGYGITRALSRTSRIAYTRLVGEIEKAINKGGPKVAQLQADKAVILSILNGDKEDK